ncbi:hypothetical protein EAKF1_ch3836c [Escherichia albertii KF1]|nr:hypothetical protein EAKF1_ch3836c [Escherichia albertii KF1]
MRVTIMQTITIINSIVKIYIRMIIKGKQNEKAFPVGKAL